MSAENGTDVDIDCFTSFYMEKDRHAVCGMVFVVDGDKKPFFKLKPEGDYLNGLLEMLIERIISIHNRRGERICHLGVHVHHSNNNLRVVLDKVRKSAEAARGYTGVVRDNIIKHTLIRKDYHKPASYEKMSELAKLLVEINEPIHWLRLSTCGDSRSPDQLAAYTACQGFWEQILNKQPEIPEPDAQPVEEPVLAVAN